MLWKNELGLPEPIAHAVMNDGYDRGHSDFTATQLIGPARARVLRKRHSHEIHEDVADRIYSLLGQSIHTILERAEVEHMAEKRLYTKIDGLVISGQLDRCAFFQDIGLLQDYKLTSVWADVGKLEWIQQLNILTYLLVQNGYKVGRAEIVAIYRDWSKSRARREPSYPQHQVKLVNIEIWPEERTLAFLKERIEAHTQAEWELPDCTPEERWYRGESWAVMKGDNKRATKLFDFRNLAEELAATDPKMRVEHRKGENIRCAEYCSAFPFCKQAQP